MDDTYWFSRSGVKGQGHTLHIVVKACKHNTDWAILTRTVKFGTHNSYDKRTTPIDFRVIWSKVKVTQLNIVVKPCKQDKPFYIANYNVISFFTSPSGVFWNVGVALVSFIMACIHILFWIRTYSFYVFYILIKISSVFKGTCSRMSQCLFAKKLHAIL